MNRDSEQFVGFDFVLNDDTEQFRNYVMGDLSYKFDLGERFTILPRIYYDQYDVNTQAKHFPDGYTIPSDIDGDGDFERFPNGFISRPIITWRRLGGEIQIDYDLSENNSFTLGFTYEWERQDNIQMKANFDTLTGASLGSMQDVPDAAIFMREAVRQTWSIYIQDKWDIGDNLGITLGVRHDHYSDFEGTTNPRLGIVWNFIENASLKLLYGQAFNPPNFQELYIQNNPVINGNPDLEPETIRTYEIGLGYKFTDSLSVNANYFFNVIRDGIAVKQDRTLGKSLMFENFAGSNVQGIEFEAKANFSDLWEGAYAFINYTYLDAESKGDPLPDVPKHKGNIGFNVGITKYLNANVHAFISDKRARVEKDRRMLHPDTLLLI